MHSSPRRPCRWHHWWTGNGQCCPQGSALPTGPEHKTPVKQGLNNPHGVGDRGLSSLVCSGENIDHAFAVKLQIIKDHLTRLFCPQSPRYGVVKAPESQHLVGSWEPGLAHRHTQGSHPVDQLHRTQQKPKLLSQIDQVLRILSQITRITGASFSLRN